jgi:hypothetical protein
MTIDAAVTVSHPTCSPFFDSPNLAIDASGTVHINDHVYLYGKRGEGETQSSTCNDCTGRDGGTLYVNATNIYVGDSIDVSGGNGSNLVVSSFPLVRSGCSGGRGGDVELHATGTLEMDEAGDLDLEGGDGGYGYGGGGNGADGASGALDWSGGTISIDEHWPPANCSNCTGEFNMLSYNAQWLDFENMTVYGRVQLNEELDHRNQSGAYYWDSGTGFIDWLEDLYYVQNRQSGTVSLVLTPSNANADLDLFVLNESITAMVGMSNGTSSSEIITMSLAAGRYYIAVSYADDGANYSTDYTLELSR